MLQGAEVVRAWTVSSTVGKARQASRALECEGLVFGAGGICQNPAGLGLGPWTARTVQVRSCAQAKDLKTNAQDRSMHLQQARCNLDTAHRQIAGSVRVAAVNTEIPHCSEASSPVGEGVSRELGQGGGGGRRNGHGEIACILSTRRPSSGVLPGLIGSS